MSATEGVRHKPTRYKGAGLSLPCSTVHTSSRAKRKEKEKTIHAPRVIHAATDPSGAS